MTISTEVSRISYTGAGTTGPFTIPFRFIAEENLTVIRTHRTTEVEDTLILNVDYTVVNGGGSGTLSTTVALSTDYDISIFCDPEFLQGYDPQQNGPFSVTTLEDALDKLTLLCQRVKDLASRAFHLSDGDTSGASAILPAPSAGMFLKWNAGETALENGTLTSPGALAVSAYGETLLNASDAGDAQDILLLDYQFVQGGRLSLDSTPFNSGDLAAQTQIYLVAYTSDRIGLYDGTRWVNKRFNPSVFVSQSRVAVPNTTNTPFDVFAYIDGSGAVRLETLDWTNDTTRATALERVGNFAASGGGCYVKNGDATRRFLGTGRTTGVAGQCHDTAANRFLWNMYNRVPRKIYQFTATASWVYSAAAYRVMEGALNYASVMCGCVSDTNAPSLFDATAKGFPLNSDITDTLAIVAVHCDTQVSSPAPYDGGHIYIGYTNSVYQRQMLARCVGTLKRGLNYIAPLEYSNSAAGGDTMTWYGSSQNAGIFGTVLM